MQLLIIRHGESDNNRLFAETGDWTNRVPDPGLTDLGRSQADALARLFAAGTLPRPDVLLSSLMVRAVMTAAPIAQACDLSIEGHLELNEVGGVYAGNFADGLSHPGSSASVLRGLSDRLVLPDQVDEKGWHWRPVETPDLAGPRAERVLTALQETWGNSDTQVAVVCHEWFAQFLLRAAMGFPPAEDGFVTAWFRLNNSGHNLIRFPDSDNAAVEIAWLNRTDHLDASQIST